MANDYLLEYEKKGTDVWWNLTITTEFGLFNVGRGIVPDTMWDDFLDIFDQSKYSSMWIQEKKLQEEK